MIIKKLIPMRQILTAILFLSSILFCRGQEDDIRRTVAFLADSVGCRYPASDGDIKVRDFLARQFRECGMKCEVQTFDIVEYMWGDGTLQLIEDTDTTDFILGTDFAVSSHSPTDTIFSGYVAIRGTLTDSLYNMVRDKIILYLPKDKMSTSPVSMSDSEQAGARAIIIGYPQRLKISQRVSKGNRNHQTRQIPVLQINYDRLAEFLPESDTDSCHGNIHIAPPSHRIRIATRHYEKRIQAANIIGTKQGNSGKYIIVGAHYDTLAPDPESGEPRRGANDNASGTAVMTALAKRLSDTPTEHNIIFIAFGGEEKGCLGSMNFVTRMPFQKKDITEMINLDMTGRADSDTLYFRQSNNTSISPTEIPSGTLVLTGGEGALSDHLDFSAAGIATSFFTTGEDPLIHTTEDTSDRLDYGSMDRITDFLADYILAIDKAGS